MRNYNKERRGSRKALRMILTIRKGYSWRCSRKRSTSRRKLSRRRRKRGGRRNEEWEEE